MHARDHTASGSADGLAPAPTDARTAESPAPPLLLVVDDDSISRRVLRDALRTLEVSLLFAQDGREALAVAEEFRPDLILLDLMLPELDGFAVIDRLRAHPTLGDVPVIVLSAYGDRENRLRGLRAGADDFVTKPFDREELRARVATACRMSRARRLADSRERFEQLIAQSPDGIALLNDAWQVTFANEVLRAMLPSRAVAELASGQASTLPSFLSLVPTREVATVRDALTALHTSDTASGRFETVLLGPPAIPVEIAAVRGLIAGRPSTTLMIRDIRHNRRLESALRESEAVEGIGLLAAEVTHDVSALLDVIDAQQAPWTPSRAPEDQELLVLRRALARARTLTSALLRAGRSPTTSGSPRIDLAAFLHEQCEFLAGLLPSGIRLQCRVPPDVPHVRADALALERAIMNLVLNARNALEGQGEISISAAVDGDGVAIIVADDGPGLDPRIAAALGTPGLTTRAAVGGSGLGLASLRRLAHEHGGRFQHEPVPGGGTRLVLWLPIPG